MTMNRILRIIIIGGIFLVPFIAFIVSTSMFFPFITGKNFAFRILTEILFGSWIILAFYNKEYRPRFSWIAVAVTAFVGVIAVADIFGVNPDKSIWSNFERMEGLVTLIHLLAYFFVVSTVLNTERLWTAFWNTSIGASVIMGIVGLSQLGGLITINQGGVRLDARLGNATYLAVYMLFHVFITTMLLLRWRSNSFARYVYGAIILLQATILYHTATRGAILGFLGGALLATLLVVLLERNRPKLRKVGIGILVGIFVIIGGFFIVKDAEFVKGSQTLGRFSGSIIEDFKDERLAIWNMAIQGFKERPILGWGQENFNLVFNKNYAPELYDQEQWFDRVHNIVLDWLIAGGILGFLAYISISLALLYLLWFRESELSLLDKSIITGFVAAYSFHNLFVFDNLISYIIFFSLLAYVHHHIASPHKEKGWLNRHVDRGVVNRLVAPLVIIVLVFSLYTINYKGMRTATALIQGLSGQQQGLEHNLELFKEAVAYGGVGTQEVREQLIQIASQARTLDIDQNLIQDFFITARSEMEKQIEKEPDDARHVLFLASMLEGYGLIDEALVLYERSHELSPNKQVIRHRIGAIHLNRGEYSKALEIFKETYELDTSYLDALVLYAVAAIYIGDNRLAEELLLPQFGTMIIDNDQLLRAYFTTGQFDKVLGIWEARVLREPNNTQFYLSLAAAHLQLNERSEAIAVIENIIELDPNFKEQGEFLIQEIRAGRNP